MKTISFKYLPIIALLLTSILSSCDNFLDIKPVGKVIPETTEDYRAMLTEAYQGVPAVRSLASLRSDELELDPWGDSASSLEDIYNWNDFSSASTTQEFPYQSFYKVIFYTNQVIQSAASSTGESESVINQLIGEAYALRAYMYFNLVITYGQPYTSGTPSELSGVPIVNDIDLEADYSPSDVETVYSQIIADITKSLDYIQTDEYEKGLNYRFSRVSVFGLAARVYLTMGEWQNALDYSNKALAINDQLVDFNLMDSINILPFNYESDENVLALEQTFNGIIAYDVYPSEKLINTYNQTEDLRFQYFLENGNSPAISTSSKDKVSMRTAEFYMIKAECEANLNQLEQAKTTLLRVLKNRLDESYYQSRSEEINSKTKDAFLTTIQNERFREFPFQGFRWYDLKRTTRPELTHIYDGATYTLEQNDSRYTLPFPQSAIDVNPNLSK